MAASEHYTEKIGSLESCSMLRNRKVKDSDIFFFLEMLPLGRAGTQFGLRIKERNLSLSVAVVQSDKYGNGTAQQNKQEAEDLNDLGKMNDSTVVFKLGNTREAP